MIDIHSHVLPLVDDGASSWEIAEEMCAMAVSDGITHMVATPHANDQFKYDRHGFEAMLAVLREKMKGKLKFSLGCDLHLSYDNVNLLFAEPARFLIESTRYVLIELSDFGLPPNFEQLLFRLRTGLKATPILTHPERNAILQRQPGYVVRCIEHGCLVQVTANSLTGFWGRPAKDAAIWLLRKKAVHFLATDAHDLLRRPPILSAGRDVAANIIGDRAASELVEENPLAVVEGREVVVAGVAPQG